MNDPIKRALLFGTFDVANYGDLLFPLIARRRLADAGIDVTPVSPTNADSGVAGAMRAISCVEAAAWGDPAQGILIGGGNIVSVRKTALRDYQQHEVGQYAYPSLWLGATMLAALHNVPVAWNAPGVPHKIPAGLMRSLARAALGAADYVAVRDEQSRRNLRPKPETRIALVPDTAIEISRLWPLNELEGVAEKLFQRNGFNLGTRYVAVHVKRRSADDVERLARDLDDFSRAVERPIVLVAIARCHDDHVVVRQVGSLMQRPAIVLDQPMSLQEITAAIAFADVFISTSLHGYISSFSYGRPGVLVSIPALSKFQSFADHVGRSGDVVRDWPQALSLARERVQNNSPKRGDTLGPDLTASLDEHWLAIVQAINSTRGNSGRDAFLRAAVQYGLRSDWGAMMRSFTGSPDVTGEFLKSDEDDEDENSPA
jgi:polysaccharide pyruvyl transferase WcaK-like protein